MPLQAAIYLRISQDRVGAGLGVTRQRQDCESLAEQRGWTVTAVYEDNDISAYSGRTRPGYQRLLEDIEAGHVGVVVAWHTDRLHRSPLELETYISACERHGVATITVRAGELDLSTAAGRMVARMLGAAARHESEQKSERVRRARVQEAEAGRLQGVLGYGWRPDDQGTGWVVDEDQAAVVREIAARLLRGDALASIARDLNARGVPTPGGRVGGWRGGNIRSMITAGRYCGWREHTPTPATGQRSRGRGMGALVAEGDWPAILDRATTESLRALLHDPARRTGGRPGRATYLLSAGVARCGRCAAPLAGHHDQKRDYRRYLCVNQPGLDRCGRLAIAADALDAFVTAAVFDALSGSVPTQSRLDDTQAHEAVANLRKQLDELAVLYADGEIGQAEWLVARKRLSERLERAQAEIRTTSHRRVLSDVPKTSADLPSYWAELSLSQQRRVIQELLASVVVQPAARGGNRVDLSRVTLNWRT
ncbi:MAG: recombinase family protein [Kineosporiaceae bacterium]